MTDREAIYLVEVVDHLNRTHDIYHLASKGILYGRGAVVVDIEPPSRPELYYVSIPQIEASDLETERMQPLIEVVKTYDFNQFAVVFAMIKIANDERLVITTLVKLPEVSRN